jgi:hypothetical protein
MPDAGGHLGAEATDHLQCDRRDAAARSQSRPISPLEDQRGLCRHTDGESLAGRAIQSSGRHNHEVGTIGDRAPTPGAHSAPTSARPCPDEHADRRIAVHRRNARHSAFRSARALTAA